MNNKRYFLGINKILDINNQIRFNISLYCHVQYFSYLYYPIYSRLVSELNNISEKYIFVMLMKYDYNEFVFFEIKENEFETIKDNNSKTLEGPSYSNIKITNNKIRFNSNKEYIIN